MALPDIRQRSGYLFLAVVLGQIILISAQVNSRRGVPVLEAVTFGVYSVVQRATAGFVSGIRRAWTGYIDLRHAHAENIDLKRRLAAAEVQLQEQRALADRSRALEQLLELHDRSNLKTVGAEIIAGGANPDFRTVTIDKGTRDGLRTDMAVIAPAGVVGRVVVPGRHAARVQLLIDRNAAAGALIERSRAQGVVMGGENRLHMEYVSETSDVTVGDLVVTSGIDGIFPKGAVIGTVESVDKAGGAYRRIVIRPAVDFGSLEEVLVVLSPNAPHESAGGSSE